MEILLGAIVCDILPTGAVRSSSRVELSAGHACAIHDQFYLGSVPFSTVYTGGVEYNFTEYTDYCNLCAVLVQYCEFLLHGIHFHLHSLVYVSQLADARV